VPSSVLKAITSGRLTKSVQRDARGRPQIDAAAADVEWRENTDSNMQRAAQRRPRAGDVVPAWPVLIDLLGQLEEQLSACLHHMAAHAPGAPAGPWEALYTAWARLPGLLERVQTEIIRSREEKT
jgi:hypothetical protein